MGEKPTLTTEISLKDQATLLTKLDELTERCDRLEQRVIEQDSLIVDLVRKNTELTLNYTNLKSDYDALVIDNQVLREEVNYYRRKRFGISSEKTSYIDLNAQGDLFAEDEIKTLEEEHPAPAQIEEYSTVKEHKKRKRGPKKLPDNLPVETVLIDIPEEEKVCACGKPLKRIGEDITEQLEYTPAKLSIKRIVRPKYACECEGTEDEEHPVVRQLPAPKRLVHSRYTENFLANLIVMRLADYMPFYRIEGTFKRLGYELCAATIDKNQITLYDRLKPLNRVLFKWLKKGKTLNCDETTMKVVNYEDPKNKDRSKSYIWLGIGGHEGKKVVFYKYSEDRTAENAIELLQGFSGYLMCDGYQAYDTAVKSLPNNNISLVNCWAHVKRKYHEAALDGKDAKATEGENFVKKIYFVENRLQALGLKGEELVAERRKLIAPIFSEFHTWLLKNKESCQPKLMLGKAIAYTLNLWNGLTNYINCPELYCDNSLAERNIKTFVMHRKASLFSNNEDGARSSCFFMSLINTAKLNGLNVTDYLRCVFEQAAFIDINAPDSEWEKLLPWNIQITPFVAPKLDS